jgi:hypothetical protein
MLKLEKLSKKTVASNPSGSGDPENSPTQEVKPAAQKTMAPVKLIFEKRALTPDEISLVYGIRKTTLTRLRAEGSGPRYCRIDGTMVAYFPRDVERWLKKNLVLPKDSE